jgi:hypothetical protein
MQPKTWGATKVLLWVIAFSCVMSPSFAEAKGFSSCKVLKLSYTKVVARSQSDKGRFIREYKGGISEIAVMPKIYATNAKLDKDRDGLLCEDDLEEELSFLATMEMFENWLGG